MANNRMYLKFKPSGRTIMLAKRLGGPWYTPQCTAEEFMDRIDKFFDECAADGGGHPDDFAIELEIPVEENTPQIL